MNPSRYRAGDLRPRYDSRRHGPFWLYDPDREEFLPDPDDLEEPRLHYRLSGYDTPGRQLSRLGRVAFWLFGKGGMCLVLILGLMAYGFVGLMLGWR